MSNRPNILTIAGSDSGAGAGIQADLKTIMALGGYGLSAITALTAQNGLTVAGIFPVDPDFVVQQIKVLSTGFQISCAKTGMLFSAEIISHVAKYLEKKTFPLVVDPVAMSQSGCPLLKDEAVQALKNELLPLSDLLTPNLPEAELLTGQKIRNTSDLLQAGQKLLGQISGSVLIKGGHNLDLDEVTDYLFCKDVSPVALTVPKVKTQNNHGTGCTLSAAIATYLGKGLALKEAITSAQHYLNQALRTSYAPGLGAGPVNHAWPAEPVL